MTAKSRLDNLEQRAGRRRGTHHVHYETGEPPCPACATSGPPKPGDTVIRVVYEQETIGGENNATR